MCTELIQSKQQEHRAECCVLCHSFTHLQPPHCWAEPHQGLIPARLWALSALANVNFELCFSRSISVCPCIFKRTQTPSAALSMAISPTESANTSFQCSSGKSFEMVLLLWNILQGSLDSFIIWVDGWACRTCLCCISNLPPPPVKFSSCNLRSLISCRRWGLEKVDSIYTSHHKIMSMSRKIVLSISSHVLLRCAVCRALSCAPPVWWPCCKTASRKQSQYKRAFLPSSVIYLCTVAPIVLVSSSTAWEGMVRHCCYPSSKATMVKEANPWELQWGAYKACLPPLQSGDFQGFSSLPTAGPLHTPYTFPPATSPSQSSSPVQESCLCWFMVKGRPNDSTHPLGNTIWNVWIPKHRALRSEKKYECSMGLKAPLWRFFLTVDIWCFVFKCTLFALPE